MGFMKLVKGSWLTMRSLGVGVLFREFLRRVAGVGYSYRGIPIRSNNDFRIVRNLRLKYEVSRLGDVVAASTGFGEFAVRLDDVSLLSTLLEPLEEMYAADVKNKVVVDVGAYIGDTAIFYVSRGARRVYAFEPVEKHFRYLVDNIARNNAVDRVVTFNYGLWVEDGVLKVKYESLGTGLTVGDEVELKVRRIGDVLREIAETEGGIDLVKMDCEGCEYALLTTPCEIIRLARQYIVEIHGAPTPLIHHMSKCGYGAEFVHRVTNYVDVYRFTIGGY
ncbi:MAG: FkbM family methyltransferase [Pyrobaculum sp.]